MVTGSQVLTALARINHALTELGHLCLWVRLWDRDVVTSANFEVKPLVNYLAGAEDVAIATFRTNLQNKYPKFYQKVIELSNIGGTDYQRIFIREFENANPSQFSKMESAISETNNVVANWKSLFDKKIDDRNVVDVITNESRIKGIVRYYTSTNPELRKIIEPLT